MRDDRSTKGAAIRGQCLGAGLRAGQKTLPLWHVEHSRVVTVGHQPSVVPGTYLAARRDSARSPLRVPCVHAIGRRPPRASDGAPGHCEHNSTEQTTLYHRQLRQDAATCLAQADLENLPRMGHPRAFISGENCSQSELSGHPNAGCRSVRIRQRAGYVFLRAVCTSL